MYTIKKLTSITALICLLSSHASAMEQNVHHHNHNCPLEHNYDHHRNTSFFVQAAYTYWAPYQEGMDLVYAQGTSSVKGNVITPKTYFSSGFKVGAGANNTDTGWFWAVNYTWFENNPGFKTHVLPSTLTYISPFASENAQFTSLSSRFYDQFNRVDGLFDRDFYSGKKFTFRPWIGFLGSWERQRLTMNGQAIQDDNNQPRIINYSQSWWGVGPYSGMNCMYNFTQNFGLYIAPGASILYAYHNWSTLQYSTPQGEAPFIQHNNYGKKFYNMEPMLEIALGLNLSYMHENFGIALSAQWQIQTYFSHNGLAGYYSPTGVMGNYTMQGLTASLRFSF
ncbi:MAG: hypothetical protein SP4CHLAM5_07140 [Chlamydiia bacterium]|nr:hypothetical protein [Chlamydiia bacterium]MCH9618581.1 hypothetical protein [Chlamydiia bacterium]MCH9623880.1 hypothetical protein [Chlamydiia bacterium]